MHTSENPFKKKYDFVIIGSGIYGIWAFVDTTLRGYQSILIDKGDFSEGASSNFYKIIHGGLRYLQHLNIKRFRESVQERKILQKIAPHLIHPIPFTIPTFKSLPKSKLLMQFALELNEILSFDKNFNLPQQDQIPRYQMLSKQKFLSQFPKFKDTPNLTGAFQYYDCQIDDPIRLNYALIQYAKNLGGIALNYCQALDFNINANNIESLIVQDNRSGTRHFIYGKHFINTTGAWAHQLLKKINPSNSIATQICKTIQFVTENNTHQNPSTIGAETREIDIRAKIKRGGRLIFKMPWNQSYIYGNANIKASIDEGPCRASVKEAQNFLNEINTSFPNENLTFQEIQWIQGSYQVLEETKSPYPQIIKKPIIQKYLNLTTIIGEKYTTARKTISLEIDHILKKHFQKNFKKTKTHQIRLYPKPKKQQQIPQSHDLSQNKILQLINRYGIHYAEVLSFFEKNRDEESDFLNAQIRYAICQEMALHLDDILVRRLGIGMQRIPSDKLIQDTSTIAKDLLNWNDMETDNEILALKKIYQFSLES